MLTLIQKGLAVINIEIRHKNVRILQTRIVLERLQSRGNIMEMVQDVSLIQLLEIQLPNPVMEDAIKRNVSQIQTFK